MKTIPLSWIPERVGVQTQAGEAVMVNALQDDSQWPCVNFAKPPIDAKCNDESRVLSVSRYSDFCLGFFQVRLPSNVLS